MRSKGLYKAVALLLISVALLLPHAAFADVLPEPVPPAGEQAIAEPQQIERDRPDAPLISTEGVLTLVVSMLVPLVATVLIETPVVAIAGRGKKRAWQVGVLVNTLTNPVAVFAALSLGSVVLWSFGSPAWAVTGVVETVVVLVEALVLWRVLRWSAAKSLAIALFANGLSFGLGYVFIFGMPF